MIIIEIVAIGNELLLGDVLDSNSHWLCRQFTHMGGRVRRVVQIGDDLAAIEGEIRGVLGRGAEIIVTGGGLGPTDDDITLQAVAAALGRPLEEDPQALAMIQTRYHELAEQGRIQQGVLTPARRKMARLPQGGKALLNPSGTAPGVLLHEDDSLIICLPGVPGELRAIFQGALAPLWAERFQGYSYDEWIVAVRGAGESTLAPFLRQVVSAYPQVYVKSRAQGFDPKTGVHVLITLSATATSASEVQADLQAALETLEQALEEAGAEVAKIERSGIHE